ncbi:hypothetical protein HMSSN139_39650 [Paenibacillus sp. HMSSN-139]|nr:hypothetical protein HMSSN139_39650 [Paenibacillus sp. HMSSN-139]
MSNAPNPRACCKNWGSRNSAPYKPKLSYPLDENAGAEIDGAEDAQLKQRGAGSQLGDHKGNQGNAANGKADNRFIGAPAFRALADAIRQGSKRQRSEDHAPFVDAGDGISFDFRQLENSDSQAKDPDRNVNQEN